MPIRFVGNQVFFHGESIVIRDDDDPSCCCSVPTVACGGSNLPASLIAEVSGLTNRSCTGCPGVNATYEVPIIGVWNGTTCYYRVALNKLTGACDNDDARLWLTIFMRPVVGGWEVCVDPSGSSGPPCFLGYSGAERNIGSDPLDWDETWDAFYEETSYYRCWWSNVSIRVYPATA